MERMSGDSQLSLEREQGASGPRQRLTLSCKRCPVQFQSSLELTNRRVIERMSGFHSPISNEGRVLGPRCPTTNPKTKAFGFVLCPLQPLTCGPSFVLETPRRWLSCRATRGAASGDGVQRLHLSRPCRHPAVPGGRSRGAHRRVVSTSGPSPAMQRGVRLPQAGRGRARLPRSCTNPHAAALRRVWSHSG